MAAITANKMIVFFVLDITIVYSPSHKHITIKPPFHKTSSFHDVPDQLYGLSFVEEQPPLRISPYDNRPKYFRRIVQYVGTTILFRTKNHIIMVVSEQIFRTIRRLFQWQKAQN
jgi:hypothetical protein